MLCNMVFCKKKKRNNIYNPPKITSQLWIKSLKFYRNTLQKQYSGSKNIHGKPIITDFIAELFHKMFIKLKYVTTLFYRQDHWPQIYTMMPMSINEFTINRNPTAGTCVLTSVIEQRARIAGPLNWSSFPVISFIKL